MLLMATKLQNCATIKKVSEKQHERVNPLPEDRDRDRDRQTETVGGQYTGQPIVPKWFTGVKIISFFHSADR